MGLGQRKMERMEQLGSLRSQQLEVGHKLGCMEQRCMVRYCMDLGQRIELPLQMQQVRLKQQLSVKEKKIISKKSSKFNVFQTYEEFGHFKLLVWFD